MLFQHAGGERADWDDAKVEKHGTHPVVYPAAGSHATFYGSARLRRERRPRSGLGCDNTSEPLRELRPRPILLPDDVTDKGPFAWLSYDGRWGQKEKGFNNGPTGPQTKTAVERAVHVMDEAAPTSPRLPAVGLLGPQVTKAFCGAVADRHGLLNRRRARSGSCRRGDPDPRRPRCSWRLTRWRPVDLEHLRARRSFGQLVRAARQLYGRHWTAMVLLALVAIPIVGGMEYLVRLSRARRDRRDLLDTFARRRGGRNRDRRRCGVRRLLVETGEASFVGAWRGLLRRFWPVVLGQLW